MKNANRGGGHINELSVAKAKLIKTPLNFHEEWNAKVNSCESIEEVEMLKYEIDSRYLFVLDFTSGECWRYDMDDNHPEDLEDFLTKNGHKVDDCEWMLTKKWKVKTIHN